MKPSGVSRSIWNCKWIDSNVLCSEKKTVANVEVVFLNYGTIATQGEHLLFVLIALKKEAHKFPFL